MHAHFVRVVLCHVQLSYVFAHTISTTQAEEEAAAAAAKAKADAEAAAAAAAAAAAEKPSDAAEQSLEVYVRLCVKVS